jgi:polyhydroxyalkanoate synthesis regulator phasin
MQRSSCALCHCCQQNICLPHLKEHQDALISQLNPFVDQINAPGDRLKAFNTENMIDNCRQKLEQWRVECHRKIDHFFEQKCQELDQSVAGKLSRLREEIDRVQPKIAELIREQDVTRRDLDSLTSTVGNLEHQMNKIEQTSFKVKMQSLEIDQDWIGIEESNRHQPNLLTLPAVSKTTQHTDGSFAALASNERFLLMHRKPNLCLSDRDLITVKKVLWNYSVIRDMC